MEVTIIHATPAPAEVVSKAAAICYAKEGFSEARVRRCFERNHLSVFEHAVVTFEVRGASRAMTHQLVRHRLASYNQESQRYVKYGDMTKDMADWFVVPESVEKAGHGERFIKRCVKAMRHYQEMLADGVPAEDARYIVPHAFKTSIIVTMNLRELFHFFDCRMARDAQWEIRELAKAVFQACCEMGGEWSWLMDLYAGEV